MMESAGGDHDTQIRAFKDFLSQYNRLSENCFTDCVWDFTSR